MLVVRRPKKGPPDFAEFFADREEPADSAVMSRDSQYRYGGRYQEHKVPLDRGKATLDQQPGQNIYIRSSYRRKSSNSPFK